MTTWNVSIEYNVVNTNGTRLHARENFEDVLYNNGFEIEYVISCPGIACYKIKHDDEHALIKLLLMSDQDHWNITIGE